MLKFKNKFHGIASLAFIDLATIISIYTLATESIFGSVLYTLYVFVAFGIIIYVYCRKCKTRNNCSHVFIGPITQLMPEAKSEKYSNTDYLLVGLLISVMFGIPQFSLFKFPILAITYWVFVLVSAIQIRLFVCARCDNTSCAMCKKQLTT